MQCVSETFPSVSDVVIHLLCVRQMSPLFFFIMAALKMYCQAFNVQKIICTLDSVKLKVTCLCKD